MEEVELKFQVPASARQIVDAAVAGRSRGRRLHLQAAYFDTPGAALAAAGLALRLRKEGRVWVQTLKGTLPGGDGMIRAEHNVPRPDAGSARPAIEPALHTESAVGALLLQTLQAAEGALTPVMGTDIWRRARTARVAGGVVELAFDVGVIEAGASAPPRRLAVCELEIELKQGHPQAVVNTAQRWVARHGLWLDTRSKAELGHLLARDDAMAAPRHADRVRLSRDMAPAAALDEVLRSCLVQISVNASQIASGRHAPEHVHQLRVGLRRLRAGLRFFDGRGLGGAIEAAARDALLQDAVALFRELGQARDRAAVGVPLAQALARAWAAAGQPGEPPGLPSVGDEVDPTGLVRQGVTQRLLLNLIARVHRGAGEPQERTPDTEPRLLQAVARRLDRWHCQVRSDAQTFDALDDEGCHRLRKRVKRLRYAVEFTAHLYDARAVRPYLKALRALQERLGAFNDVVVGAEWYASGVSTDARALFALGWLVAQKEATRQACRPELEAWVAAARYWRKPSRRS